MYLALIARAKRRIYAESQYFASRRIAEAIAKRLVEPDPPEIVVINPTNAQGWLEPIAMDTARARLVAELQHRDHAKRFRMYHPVTTDGTGIYCHAKVMVVDDDVIRIGSSNFNNRSLRLDTECDVTIADDGDRIAAIRDDLLAEHLAIDVAQVSDGVKRDGLIATIERLRGSGKTLIPYEIPDLNGVEAWLAENEVLDPEGPAEMFEAFEKRGLLRRLRHRRHRRRRVHPAVPRGCGSILGCGLVRALLIDHAFLLLFSGDVLQLLGRRLGRIGHTITLLRRGKRAKLAFGCAGIGAPPPLCART